ncbi:IPT/TIG domain-containing protein [Salinibacterium sp. GXW1014]|uniref:IPT/TIG domain-containing protein n=1 Tax=Salinibacterium sp. GXW1014 TaxID=3377838 RepID=UPI003839EAB1
MATRELSSGLLKGAATLGAAALLMFGAAAPAAAAVDAVSPDVGPVAGGNTVTITGDCFAGATEVSFGGVPAPAFAVVSDTTVTATVPPGASGTVDVAVSGAGACGVSELPDGYRYTSNPIIWALSPAEGPVAGGTAVTIEGANLAGVTAVYFGGVEIADFTLVSSTQIVVFSPPGAVGTVDVVAEGPYGSSTAPFSYVQPGGGAPLAQRVAASAIAFATDRIRLRLAIRFLRSGGSATVSVRNLLPLRSMQSYGV